MCVCVTPTNRDVVVGNHETAFHRGLLQLFVAVSRVVQPQVADVGLAPQLGDHSIKARGIQVHLDAHLKAHRHQRVLHQLHILAHAGEESTLAILVADEHRQPPMHDALEYSVVACCVMLWWRVVLCCRPARGDACRAP